MDMQDIAVAAVVLLAGFVRGVTGFGGAMVMAPPLSIIVGPVEAVVVTLLLETAAAFVMFPKALPQVNWRVMAYLTIPACFTVGLGGYLLVTLDPAIARKVIAAVVVVSSIALLSGVRYSGSPRPVTSVALGSLVGVLLGASSVGAPPVILYLLSGPDPHRVTRANLTFFVTAISVIGLVMLAIAGAITTRFALYAAALTIPYMAGTWAGGLLFERMSETGMRRFALIFMCCMGLVGLFA
ncbi:MAG: sulfite exporter TauE/SafE family protein [Hyphomicrobiales bacterium]